MSPICNKGGFLNINTPDTWRHWVKHLDLDENEGDARIQRDVMRFLRTGFQWVFLETWWNPRVIFECSVASWSWSRFKTPMSSGYNPSHDWDMEVSRIKPLRCLRSCDKSIKLNAGVTIRCSMIYLAQKKNMDEKYWFFMTKKYFQNFEKYFGKILKILNFLKIFEKSKNSIRISL